jgi:hypothetical protein
VGRYGTSTTAGWWPSLGSIPGVPRNLYHLYHLYPSSRKGWTLPELPALAIHETRAFVMLRHPVFYHEGMMVLMDGAFTWQEVPYVDSVCCEHNSTLCPNCQKDWYYEHNIRLVSIFDPSISTDFDEIARQYREANGIPEPSLIDYLQ